MAEASASVLPPPPAQRSRTCLPFTSPAEAAAICEPRSCTSNQPLENCGIVSTAPERVMGSSAGMRSAVGSRSTGSARSELSAFSVRSGSDFSRLTRRSTGARAASAAASSARAAPKARVIAASSQSG